MPALAVKQEGAAVAPVSEEKQEQKKGGGGDDGGRRLPPFIQGLLDTIPDIPDPKEKPEWPMQDRVKWLQTAANIFDLLYKGEGGISVTLARADRSPRHDD